MKLKLNPRQEKFCVEYAKTGNATQAYRSAGFQSKSYQASQANSARLLADEKIQARLKELSAQIEKENIADISEIQLGLTKIFRGQETTPLMTKDGEVIQVPVSAKDRLKAAEILCKTHGAFISKQELSISELAPVVIRDNI